MKKINISEQYLEPLFDKVEGLPKSYRILILVGVFAVMIGASVYFLFLPKHEDIKALQAQRETLNQKLLKAKANAAQKDKYRKQYEAAQEEFKIAKRALPGQKEIPSLLESISSSGQDVGLDFALFQPGSENKKDFYAEIPVAISVTGSFHNVASFFDRISRLSRIVNIRNVGMSPTGRGAILSTTCTAVTYRFLETAPPKKG